MDPDGRDAIVTFKKDGGISIDIPIRFLGRAVSNANVNKVKNDISNRLSGTYKINGKETKVDVTVTEPKSTGKINYIDLTQEQTSRKACGGCSFVSGGQFGEWNINENYNDAGVASHEAVHLMGGADHYTEEYDENGIRVSTKPEEKYKGNLMGELSGKLDNRNFQEILSSQKNEYKYEK